MPSFLSLSVQALVLSSLCICVFGQERRQLRAKRLEDIVEREQAIDKRGVCYDDSTYESFKYWIEDSAPYCSSLLGLSDITRTVSRTSRTTTSPLSTTYVTRTATSTVPAFTIFSTTFVPNLNKRAAATTTAAPIFYQENPYAYSVYAGNAPNASIAASYYSACSCLSLQSSTVDETSVILTTRTIRGLDTQETTSYVFVTTGTTTQLLTRQGNPPAPTTTSSTISVIPVPPSTRAPSVTSAIGTGSSIVGSLSSSFSPSIPGFNTSRSLSSTFASSGTRPTTAPTLNITSFSVSSLRPTISVNSTTRLPTANTSLTTRASSGFPPLPTGNQTTSLASSGLPRPSINSSITSRPTSGIPRPSANSTRPTIISSGFPMSSVNLTVSSRPTSGLPLPSTNASSPTRATSGLPRPSGNSSSSISTSWIPTYPASFSTIFVTVTAPSISSSNSSLAYVTTAANTTRVAPTLTTTPASNSTRADVNTVALSSTPTLDIRSCPGLNGTEITLPDGQAFTVVCSTEYSGPVDIGLSERTFNDCILDCATANNGFSDVGCRAVTYFPTRPPGEVNCYLKTPANLDEAFFDPDSISAVLIHLPLLSTTLPVPTSFPSVSETAVPRFADD